MSGESIGSWSPTLPHIKHHEPLALLLSPFGYDGDVSSEPFANPPEPSADNVTTTTVPELFVVPEAVEAPESTEVPEAVPVGQSRRATVVTDPDEAPESTDGSEAVHVEQVPVGTAIVHESPVITQGERVGSVSSSPSSSSSSTTRPAEPASPIEVQRKSSVTFAGDHTANRSTTFVIQVPEEPQDESEGPLRRRSTTIKVVIEPANSSDERLMPARESPTHTLRVPSEQTVFATPADSTRTEVPQSILKNKTEQTSVTSKQSKRDRIRALWRRLIAKIMQKKAERAARKVASGGS
ncbi:hypothetical protein SLS57_004271 [Botryosphaeria dothidea]